MLIRSNQFTALLLSGALLAAPSLALAQRNGDVSNGMNNQPTSGEVRSKESAGGVAPSPQRNQAQTGAVDNIYKDLMTKENRDGLTNAPTNPTGPLTTAPVTTQGAAPSR
ncbi:MAG: hypothetical protein ACRYGM_18170 [Janthinobacterium lividum]